MPMTPVYDHTTSEWAVAAMAWLDEARDDIEAGRDALPAISAVDACLRIEAGELPPDPDLRDELD